MLFVDDLAAGGTKNLRHTPRGLVTLYKELKISSLNGQLPKDELKINQKLLKSA